MNKADRSDASALHQVAASSQIPPAPSASADTPRPKRLTLALRYGTKDDQCKWVLMYPTKGTSPATEEFTVTEMESGDITKRVVLGALEKVITAGLHNIDLCIEQQELRQHAESVRDIIPTMRIIQTDDPLGSRLDRKAQTLLGKWQHPGQRTPESEAGDARAATGKKKIRRSPERTVYVNTTYDRNKRDFGIGYVVRDTYVNVETGEEVWNLRFFSSTSTLPLRGDESLATLRAITRVLSGRNVLSRTLKSNTRSLVVFSPDRKAVQLLSALRHGESPQGEVTGLWSEPASRIIAMLRGIREAAFAAADERHPLIETAGRLALATIRNERFDISGEPARDIMMQIASDTLETLKAMNISATIGEVSTDNESLSGSLPPREHH